MEELIIIDTNIWLAERLMTTPLGASLTSAIKRKNLILVIPEVVNKEIQKHILKQVRIAIEDIEKGYKIIEMFMGSRDNYRVPEENELFNRFFERLAELKLPCYSQISSYQQYKNALERVMNEIPPNAEKNQQFKDSLIWEIVLELSDKNIVHFITEDKGFFKQKDSRKGLCDELIQEIKKYDKKIYVHYKIDKYLDSIKDNIPDIDKALVAQKINDAIYKRILLEVNKKGNSLEELLSQEIKIYLTEQPSFLSVDFVLTYCLMGVFTPSQDVPSEARVIAS